MHESCVGRRVVTAQLHRTSCCVFPRGAKTGYPARAIISAAGICPPGKGTDLPVALDEQHVALPKLYGAPAYSRPPRPVEVTERPLDPDDLPIAAFQTDEEREIAETLGGRPYAPAVAPTSRATARPTTRRRVPSACARSPAGCSAAAGLHV